MKISMISSLTGNTNTMELDLSEDQILELASPKRRLIHRICPNLNADEREFLLSGITPDEWKKEFGDD